MRRLGIEVTLRAPTLLAAAPPISNLTETLPFLPGNSLRGALARRYVELGGEPQDGRFQRLFLSGDVTFGAAYVEGAEVVPLSARTCKYDGGFHADGGHGVVDLLLSAAAGGDDRGSGCPVCRESLDHAPGFRLPGENRRAQASMRLITRTAVDSSFGTARTGHLFVQQVLEEEQRFVAEVECPEELSADLDRLIGTGFEAILGTGGSRGQGWVEIAPAPPPAPPWAGTPAAERCRRYPMADGKPVLAVTLLSDGFFFDDYLRASFIPSIEDLVPLGVDPGDWDSRPFQAFTDVRRVFGFDGEPVNLPRPHRLAVAAGSAFLFKARGEPRAPEGTGAGWIGDGRREGYGRAVLWHPFHLEPDPRSATAEDPP